MAYSSSNSSSSSSSSSSTNNSNSSSIIINNENDSTTTSSIGLTSLIDNLGLSPIQSITHQHQQQQQHNYDNYCDITGYYGSDDSSSSSFELSSLSHVSSTIKKERFILNAFVNGFVQLKLCADKIDFEYIIEIYWSDTSKSFIKRTYDDFVLFHRNLMEFIKPNHVNKSTNASNNNSNNLQSMIPSLPGKKPFWVSNLKLAEQREIQLNQYVQRIVKLPIDISQNSLIVDFFKTKSCDPKPAASSKRLSQCYEDQSYINSPLNESENDFNSLNESNLYQLNADNNNYCNQLGDISKNIRETNTLSNYTKQLNANSTLNNQLNIQQQQQQQVNNEDDNGLWWDEDNALTNELTLCSRENDFDNIESLLQRLEFEDNIV